MYLKYRLMSPIAYRIKKTFGASNKLMHFMKQQVAERQPELWGQTESSKRQDIFTILVKANENESGKYRLDDEELVCHVISSMGVLLFLTVQKDRQCFRHAFCGTRYLISHIMLTPMVQYFLRNHCPCISSNIGISWTV